MRFDAALAAQQALRRAEPELGPDWDQAVEWEDAFSSQAGAAAREAYDALLALAVRYPKARAFHAFCAYITRQQITEETIARHFHTGIRLCDDYLALFDGIDAQESTQIRELAESFRAGLGLEEEDEMATEYRRDTPKGGD